MRFTVIVDGSPVEGVLEKAQTEGFFDVRIEGRVYRVEAVLVEPSVYWLQWGDRSIEAVVCGNDVSIGARRFNVEVVDERGAASRRARASSSSSGSGALADVRAPMPGKIVRTLVSPGDSVEAGRALVVIEAMKMQNEIRAPRAGIVKSIAVSEGGRVASGDLLATLE